MHTTEKSRVNKTMRDSSSLFWLEWQSFIHQQMTYLHLLRRLPVEYKWPMSHTVMTKQWQVYIPTLTTELSKTLFLPPHVMFPTQVSHSISILTSWGWERKVNKIMTFVTCHQYLQVLTLFFLSFLYRASFQHMEWKPTDVTILFVYCCIATCFGPTGPSSGEFVQLFTQPLVQCLCRSVRKRTERHRHWTNDCVNSCTNSPEDGPVGPKHVEIQQYTNKIVTSVGFHSIRTDTNL